MPNAWRRLAALVAALVVVVGADLSVGATGVVRDPAALMVPRSFGAPAEFPDETTTGVPTGVTLTPTDQRTITEDGTVIDGRHLTGRVVVEANDVIIRNSLVETSTNLYAIHVTSGTTGTLIENVEVDNLGGAGIGIFMQGSGTVRRANIHSNDDGIRIQADNVTIEDSYIHDLQRKPGGHHDTIQIRRGDNITIQRNNLQAYVESTNDPMNSALQIGSLAGSDRITNLRVIGNLMNGGNHTINGGGRGEVASALYAHNRFGRDQRFSVQASLQNSVWDNSNVWDDTGMPVRPSSFVLVTRTFSVPI